MNRFTGQFNQWDQKYEPKFPQLPTVQYLTLLQFKEKVTESM